MLLEFLLISLTALHTWLTEVALLHPQDSPLDLALRKMKDQFNFYGIFSALMLGLKMFLILSFYLETIKHRYIPGLSWLSQQVFSSYSLFKEIDLALTSFLCLLSWKDNLVFLVISFINCLVYALYMQNYVVRKSLTYATSYYDYFMFRSLIALNYSANIMFLQAGDKLLHEIFCSGLAGFVLIWFVRSGHRLYYHTYISRMLSAVVALLLTFYFKLTEKLILSQEVDFNQEICKVVLIFSLLLLIFWHCLERPKLAVLEKMGSTPIK